MSECSKCKGTGFIVEGETVCPVCHGSGKVKSVDLTSLNEEDLPGLLSGDLNCKKCGGTGKIPVKKRCEKCNGSGVIVHKLHNACDLADVEIGDLYEGVVGDVVAFGAFVYLNSNIKGLAHSSKLKREPSHADKMVVEVRSIQANGNIELVPVSVSNYFLVDVKKDLKKIYPVG
jgi:RecJ-like exonuclease